MGTFNVFYFRVCRTEFDLKGSDATMSEESTSAGGLKLMDFVLWDATKKKSCAYRFERQHGSISSSAKLEVWEFNRKNRDPWDRLVLNTYREADEFETDSLQLTSQFPTKKAFGDTSRDHTIRFVLWIGTRTVEIGGKLRYPQPVENFACSGRIQLLDTRRQFESVRS